MDRVERVERRANRDDAGHRFEARPTTESMNRQERRFDPTGGVPRESRVPDTRRETSTRTAEMEQRPVRQRASAPTMASREDYNRRRYEEREARPSANGAEPSMTRQNVARERRMESKENGRWARDHTGR